MILSCSSISRSFGDNHILKRVSFHIEEHEKAAIVGINGAGKSTCFNSSLIIRHLQTHAYHRVFFGSIYYLLQFRHRTCF